MNLFLRFVLKYFWISNDLFTLLMHRSLVGIRLRKVPMSTEHCNVFDMPRQFAKLNLDKLSLGQTWPSNPVRIWWPDNFPLWSTRRFCRFWNSEEFRFRIQWIQQANRNSQGYSVEIALLLGNQENLQEKSNGLSRWSRCYYKMDSDFRSQTADGQSGGGQCYEVDGQLVPMNTTQSTASSDEGYEVDGQFGWRRRSRREADPVATTASRGRLPTSWWVAKPLMSRRNRETG